MADRERVPLEYQSQLPDEYETEVPPEDEAYTLEEILEEYGGGLERKLSEGAASPAAEVRLEPKQPGGLGFGLASLAGRLKRGQTTEAAERKQTAETPEREQAEVPPAWQNAAEPDSTAKETAASFSDRARKAAERAGQVWNRLKNLLSRLKGPLTGGAAAVRRVLAGIRLPTLPAGTRIPVLSAAADKIEAERRKRRPKRNRIPVPIPGRRRGKKPVPPEDTEPEDMEPEELPPEDGEDIPAEEVLPEKIPPEGFPPEDIEDAEAAEPAAANSSEPENAEPENDEPDSGEPENAEPENGEAENGEADSGETDTGEPDSGEPDTGEADSGEPEDGENPDSGEEKTGGEPDSLVHQEEAQTVDRNRQTNRSGREQPEERQTRTGQNRRPLFSLLRKRKQAAEEPIGPEIPLHDAAARFREAYTRRQVPPLALAAGGLPTLLLLLEWAGAEVPLWSGNVPFRCLLTLLCLGGTAYLCRQVFTTSVTAFACGVSAAAAALDCLIRIFSVTRSPGDGFGAVACLALVVAQWGVSLESRGRFEAFRAASLDDEPPFLITDMEQGASKQRGSTTGFYSTAMRPDSSTLWQTVLLPLTLAISVVLAGISSFGQDRGADFFLNWSAILAAGATFTLPLCWGLPWAHLARRLQKSGGAVAGWAGAEKLSRQKNMIVTDADLFPQGAVQLNGIRLFGGDMDKAVSCAAAVTKEAGCGLERPFRELLQTELGEGAEAPEAEEFNFYEEGGYGAVINGEEVLMGTAAFLRRMGVLLPRDLKLSGGMYLAVEHRLLAVFAIRYNPADNVDYALRLLRRSGVTPLLAVRDPNINPAMLQRKFRRKIPVKYPPLAGRIALSEVEYDRNAPRALLFRDGLLPYAEVVVGCRRLCGGVRRATILSEFGSLAGMVLICCLCSLGKFALLTPLSLIVFLLLWLLPVLLVMELF